MVSKKRFPYIFIKMILSKKLYTYFFHDINEEIAKNLSNRYF